MFKSFHNASPFKGLEFDEKKVNGIYDAYLKSDKKDIIVIIAEDDKPFGFIVGICESLPFSSDKVAMELAWWVDEDHRGHRDSILLMKAYEDWSVRVGAKMTQMAMLEEVTDLHRFYKKMGYRPAETSYIKDI